MVCDSAAGPSHSPSAVGPGDAMGEKWWHDRGTKSRMNRIMVERREVDKKRVGCCLVPRQPYVPRIGYVLYPAHYGPYIGSKVPLVVVGLSKCCTDSRILSIETGKDHMKVSVPPYKGEVDARRKFHAAAAHPCVACRHGAPFPCITFVCKKWVVRKDGFGGNWEDFIRNPASGI
jgi:hypothetical protein